MTPAASRHLDAIPHQGSESALLAEALERGLEALADEARDEGYRQLAEVFETDPEERAIREALRARRGRFRSTGGHDAGTA
jgi:DNA/RNA-binding domain of Phe-tRNA-synthetase-like protein